MTDSGIGSSAAPEVTRRPLPLVLRLLSGVGGVIVFLIGLLFSVGAILGAPLGIWLVHRWTKRHERRPSRIAELVGSVLAASVLAGVVWSLIFALAPGPTPQELQSAVAQRQSQPAVKLPGWYTKAFPQAARIDSASQKMIKSPEFIRMTLVLGAGFVALFFGVLGGAMGWSALALMRRAWYERRAA
jgi:vacuolar-type H+-ATPase subunit I/STV1